MPIKIFVEGTADLKFIRDYLGFAYDIKFPNDGIIVVGGWTKIFSSRSDGEMIRNKISQNSDNNGSNLLIFDADVNFRERLKEIEDWKRTINLNFEIFLFPNHKDNGDLETVLENIINPINFPIFECWDDYEACLQSKKIEGRQVPLTSPARKTKIYGYLEALLGKSNSQKEKIKEDSRDYRNTEHWDLNSTYLNNLKIFLDKYFK